MIMPLSGAFGGALGAFLVCSLGIGFKLAIGSALTFKFLAYHIPGLCAALYWGSNSVAIRMLIPFACMIAFISNPVGGQIWAYSLFWLIPIMIALINKKTLFLQALGSTFTAHAVGTAIWIWATPTTPAFWLMLVPIVIIERSVFALGTVVMYKALQFCSKTIAQRVRLFGVHIVN
jgi:hypothetical protein